MARPSRRFRRAPALTERRFAPPVCWASSSPGETLAAVLLAFGIILAATLDAASPLDADVNGAYLVIQSDSPRDWSGLNLRLNREWAFKVPKQAVTEVLC